MHMVTLLDITVREKNGSYTASLFDSSQSHILRNTFGGLKDNFMQLESSDISLWLLVSVNIGVANPYCEFS